MMLLSFLLACSVNLDCDRATAVTWHGTDSNHLWRVAALSGTWTERGIDACVVPGLDPISGTGLHGDLLTVRGAPELYSSRLVPMRFLGGGGVGSLELRSGPATEGPGPVYWPTPTHDLALRASSPNLDWDGTRFDLLASSWAGGGVLPDEVAELALSADGAQGDEATGAVAETDLLTWGLMDAPGVSTLSLDLPGPRQRLAVRTAAGAAAEVRQPEGLLVLAGADTVDWLTPAEDLCLALGEPGIEVPVAPGGTLRVAAPTRELVVSPETNSARVHLPDTFEDVRVTVPAATAAGTLEIRVGRAAADPAEFEHLTIHAEGADVELALPDHAYRFTGTTPDITDPEITDDPDSTRTVEVVAATLTVALPSFDAETDACRNRAAEAVELLDVEP